MNSTSFCMFIFSSPLASMFFWSSIGFASFFPTSRSGSIMDSSDKTLLPNSGKLSVNQDVSNVDIYEWLWHYNKWSDFLSKNFIWIRISTWLVRDKTLREIIEKKTSWNWYQTYLFLDNILKTAIAKSLKIWTNSSIFDT